MRVVIAGGGIGGLALAQGLKRAGIEVLVAERDVDLTATGGYRLHLRATALQALRVLLPPSLVERLYAASAADHHGIAVRDHRARLLVHAAPPAPAGPGRPPDPALDVDRITLRLVLADGLDDVLRLGTTVVAHTADAHGVTVRLRQAIRPTEHIESEVRCDLLVAADGARSTVAAQLAGGPTATPTGFSGIAGWTSVDALSDKAREVLATGSLLAVGPGGAGLYASWHDPARDSPLHPHHRQDNADGALGAGGVSPIARVIWGVIALETALPTGLGADLRSRPPEQVLAIAVAALRERGWTQPLRSLVERADPATVGAFSFLAADPDHIAPWPASRATALGDAAHAVPPTGGRGAATAVEDAADLCATLQQAAAGEVTAVMAVHDYEQQLRARGAAAVRESLQPLGWIKGTATPAGAVAARLALPVASAAASGVRKLRRR